MLPAIKKFAHHIITKFRFPASMGYTFSKLFRFPKYYTNIFIILQIVYTITFFHAVRFYGNYRNKKKVCWQKWMDNRKY